MRPDWSVTGFQYLNKYRILATTDVTWAQIEMRVERDQVRDIWLGGLNMFVPEPGLASVEITVKTHRYVMVEGDSYAEAWAILLKTWQPEPVPKLEGRKAIGHSD